MTRSPFPAFRYVLLLFLVTLSCSATPSPDRTSSLLLATREKGVYVSGNGGRSWDSLENGLPDEWTPLMLYESPAAFYVTTYESGIFRLPRHGTRWENIAPESFRVRSMYDGKTGFRKISAFAIDTENKLRLVAATKHSLYESLDEGKSWRELPIQGIKSNNYITALALRGAAIYAGTAFNGVFVGRGGAFTRISRGLPVEPYSKDMVFFEEIEQIDVTSTGALFAQLGFGGGLYRSTDNGASWEKMPPMGTIPPAIEKNLPRSGGPAVLVIPDPARKAQTGIFRFAHDERRRQNARAQGKYALYASVPIIRKNADELVTLMTKCGLNAIVIDMKDDFGNIYFPTKNKTALEIRSAKKPVEVEAILKKLHDHGIHVIARLVTFKDEKLYRAYNGTYAIHDSATKKPWRGSPHEYWVDPHSAFVHDYNIALAQELEKLGFDEIQFDYIRFPSDGPTHRCLFPFRTIREMYKSEILIDFLKKAKRSLTVPLSVDIYGFNSWYHFGNWIGQNMEEFSYVVDAISPMVYPSHFGRYLRKVEPAEHPHAIVYQGGLRSQAMINDRVVVRPYLQAFKMLSPTWGPGYIQKQIDGAKESGCGGYIFWNAKGEYEMLGKAAAARGSAKK